MTFIFSAAEWFPEALVGLGAILLTAVTYRHSKRVARQAAWDQFLSGWRQIHTLQIQQPRLRALLRGDTEPNSTEEEDALDGLLWIYLGQAMTALHAHKSGAMRKRDFHAEITSICLEVGGVRGCVLNLIGDTPGGRDASELMKLEFSKVDAHA